jgi:hypothetical protein
MPTQLSFRKLNDGWNAEPNAPRPVVEVVHADVWLRFALNTFQFRGFTEGDIGILRFVGCARYRLGPTNDEGWYRGQCRYSKVAPAWGEFYEIAGSDPRRDEPRDWIAVDTAAEPVGRHFLFYFRDETFECLAADWHFEPIPENALFRSSRSI